MTEFLRDVPNQIGFQTSNPFRRAVESGQIQNITDVLYPSIEFYSPLISAPVKGPEKVLKVIRKVGKTLEKFHFISEFADQERTALYFRALVDGKSIEGVDLITLGPDSLVREIRVSMRPMENLDRFAAIMVPFLEDLIREP